MLTADPNVRLEQLLNCTKLENRQYHCRDQEQRTVDTDLRPGVVELLGRTPATYTGT